MLGDKVLLHQLLIIHGPLAGDGGGLFQLDDLILGGLKFRPATVKLGLQLQLACLIFLILARSLALFGK